MQKGFINLLLSTGDLQWQLYDMLKNRNEWWVPGKLVELRQRLEPYWRVSHSLLHLVTLSHSAPCCNSHCKAHQCRPVIHLPLPIPTCHCKRHINKRSLHCSQHISRKLVHDKLCRPSILAQCPPFKNALLRWATRLRANALHSDFPFRLCPLPHQLPPTRLHNVENP